MSEHSTYPIDEIIQQKPWSLPESFRYCERLAKTHYENFPVGSILIPKKLRPYVWAIYAFARRADDIADEDFIEEDRIPALEAWKRLLERCVATRVNHPVFLAIQETIRQFNIPVQLLIDLITAFKMDVKVKRYPRFEDVLYYCRHSANPVGRLVLLLFGYRDEICMQYSDKICSALQLANFWQDVAVDLKKNRIYIPQEDMKRIGYTETQIFNHEYNAAFKELLKFQVDRTEQMFKEGAALIDRVKGRLRLELKCTVLGGMGILDKVKALDYNTLKSRPHFESKDKVKILFKALFGFRRAVALPRSKALSGPPLNRPVQTPSEALERRAQGRA